MPFPRRKIYYENFTPTLYKKSVSKTKNSRYVEKDVAFDKCKPLPSASMFDLTAIIESGNDAKLKPANCEFKSTTPDFGYSAENKNDDNNNTNNEV